MEAILSIAIDERRLVSFAYDGSRRVAEPHTLGRSKSGVLTLCAWQLTGGSGEGWRDFHLNRMGDLELTEENFSIPRPGYNPNPSKLSVIATL
ncbi:WYL domain-containing protein [Flaviflagellibacter deserti]|uniref:WYL domain-containing protein n=1 Tax=Flaviflagellibacter deserti TaxID=2267266 RepID=A0ABV9YXW6_9HYPH